MDAHAMSQKVVDDGISEYSIGNRTNVNAPVNMGPNIHISQPRLRDNDIYGSDGQSVKTLNARSVTNRRLKPINYLQAGAN